MNNKKRLFHASFLTLVAAGIGFSIRGGILSDWGTEFGFTQSELGTITGGGLAGFGLTIIFFSLVADRIGYGPLMIVAFVLHALSAIVTLSATPVFHAYGKSATYWVLYIGMFLFALGNGTAEAVINPLTATLYPKEKTHYLNVLHAGWPGGLIVGGVLSFLLANRVAWEIQIAIFLIPTVMYGLMMFGQKFPLSEAKVAGATFRTMARQFLHPVLITLLALQALVGYVELGTDSWISNLMTSIANMHGVLVLVYTAGIMFVLRFFVGPIVHRISPMGLLVACAVTASVGLFMLGSASTSMAIFIAATIYGIGKTFFWPTMLGVVSERFPKGGALVLGSVGGIGMLSAGLLGAPGIGYVQDYYASRKLAQENAPIYEWYASDNKKSFLFFPTTTGLDGSKVGTLESTPDSQLTDAGRAEKKLVKEAVTYGGRMSLKWTAVVPAIMALGYLTLILYFRTKGGYKVIHITGEFA